MASAVEAALQAKAEEKRDFVQTMIRGLEKALTNNTEKDRRWLQDLINPKNACFPTLIKLLIEPKYKIFDDLRCVTLRAVHIILRVAAQTVPVCEANMGMMLLEHLAGERLAGEVFPEVCRMAEEGGEPLVSCLALLVLAELGPEALAPHHVQRLLDLFVALPDRADDLVEVALHVHAGGGKPREALLHMAVSHPGGMLLCEVLLQVINLADKRRRLRALKVLAGCLALPSGEDLLYTNDVRVLVEILIRELPNHTGDTAAFACHTGCFKALLVRCEAARAHRRPEVLQVLEDLYEDEQHDPAVREECAEVLRLLAQGEAR